MSNAAAQTYGIGSQCIEHDSTWRASDGSFFWQQVFNNAIKFVQYLFIC